MQGQRGSVVLEQILKDLISAVKGARAAAFLDGDGELIAQAGDGVREIKLLGAWKEIHLDHIKEITSRLSLGSVKAVLFSLDEGTELIAPVHEDYSLILFMSAFSDVREAMNELGVASELLKKDIT